MPRQDLQSQDFAERLRPHGVRLLRYLRHMLHRPDQAADVLQATVAAALAEHVRFDPDSCFRAWIYRFATHAALNANRRWHRDRQVFAGGTQAPDEAPADAEGHLAAELAYDELLADPDRVLKHLDEPLNRAVAELQHQQRAALLLRTQGDLSCAEIAKILEVPKGTVMSALFRARAHLRRRLSDWARDRGWKVTPE